MSLRVKPLEFFGGFIKFNLSCLCFCNLLLKFSCFACNFNGEFFYLKGEFFNFGFISASVLFQSQIIFLLLSSGKSPLFQLFLIPVHFKFELVHFLIRFEYLILDVVKSILLVSNSLLKFFNFILETSTLTLCDLFQVLFSFNFFIFSVYQTLSVDQLHFYRLKVLI